MVVAVVVVVEAVETLATRRILPGGGRLHVSSWRPLSWLLLMLCVDHSGRWALQRHRSRSQQVMF